MFCHLPPVLTGGGSSNERYPFMHHSGVSSYKSWNFKNNFQSLENSEKWLKSWKSSGFFPPYIYLLVGKKITYFCVYTNPIDTCQMCVIWS